jgi:hypothetical protein
MGFRGSEVQILSSQPGLKSRQPLTMEKSGDEAPPMLEVERSHFWAHFAILRVRRKRGVEIPPLFFQAPLIKK